jgi:hypothetical protein
MDRRPHLLLRHHRRGAAPLPPEAPAHHPLSNLPPAGRALTTPATQVITCCVGELENERKDHRY